MVGCREAANIAGVADEHRGKYRADLEHLREPSGRDNRAGVDELLGEEISEPARSLNCPCPLRGGRGPAQHLIELPARGPHLDPRQLNLDAVDRDGLVQLLVRIDTDHHARDGGGAPLTAVDGVLAPVPSDAGVKPRRVATH